MEESINFCFSLRQHFKSGVAVVVEDARVPRGVTQINV